MKKAVLAGLISVCVMLLFVLLPAYGEPAESFDVSIIQLNNGEDNQSFGLIGESVLSLSEGQPVGINMAEVFEMYPEHSGIYGMLYSASEVTISAAVSGEEVKKTGTGVLEFSFPGATTCTVSGNGNVYAYFLPVPYQRVSVSSSMVNKSFDTSYLTTTAVGHSNMFIIIDAHSFMFQDSIPDAGTVYKYKSSLGPIPSDYRRFAPTSKESPSLYSFVYNTPVLIQCDALSKTAYQNDTYTVRPMEKIAGGDEYDIWIYKDYETKSQVVSDVRDVFDAGISLAKQHFLGSGRKIDKILIVMLGEELGDLGMNGLAVSEELYGEIGFQHQFFINTWGLEDCSNYKLYLIAHELGHIVQHASLAYGDIAFMHWFSEGFATYFGEEVCQKIGKPYRETAPLNENDSKEINKFHTNLVFGINDFDSFHEDLMSDNPKLIYPWDGYSFGSLFFRYCKAKYGESFYKRVSEVFYTCRYKGYENRFFDRRNDFNYTPDDFFGLVRKALGKDVYIDFPAYVYNEMPDMVVKEAINPVREGNPDPDGLLLPGDVNKDGAVDGLDVIRLMKYLAEEIDSETGMVYEINKNNADVTGDGLVDELDLLRIVKYLGGEDVVLEEGNCPSPVND